MIVAAAWVGAICMALAPFIIDTDGGKMMAISGLVLLTIQALDIRAWNLVLLNLAGIIGYCYALYI
jgi:threonine/homoserine efflux transporter RhtA|tara:strand:+ start:375 stop:572 length:198 start_codon:yes stop_codon:yes gene_type:complete